MRFERISILIPPEVRTFNLTHVLLFPPTLEVKQQLSLHIITFSRFSR